MVRKIIKIFILIILIVAISISLVSCNASDYPRPTKEYYINDYADVLLPGTKKIILSESERLYQNTRKNDIGAAQIVVATMKINNAAELNNINRSELFGEWRIKETGILIMLVFLNENNTQRLLSAEIEIGETLEQYVSSNAAADLIETCLFNPEWEGVLDMGLGELYYELLSAIYINVYGYNSFSYDMDQYINYINVAEDYESSGQMNIIEYIFSPYSVVWLKVLFFLPTILLVFGAIIVFTKKRQSTYYYRRRR